MLAQEASPNSEVSRPFVRIVIEAECNQCGPIVQQDCDAGAILQAATLHTAVTGHVVILNGTVDLPQLEDSESSGMIV